MPETNGSQVSAASGLVSIIIPCCGQLEYTKLCVPSVLRHSRPPFELIFLDIGSLDGTAEYLAGVASAAPVRVEIVRTAMDLGIPAACFDVLAQAPGQYVGLFDTDLLSLRGRQAGFTLACCKDLFIHHFGSRTFAHGAPAGPINPQNQ